MPRTPVKDADIAGLIAHELNNIAVPMRGFIDLAAEKAAPDGLARQCLDEIDIGMVRVVALAHSLEGLSLRGSDPRVTTVGECLVPAESLDSRAPPRLVWTCSPKTPVTVDLDHARRAIESLVYLAGAAPLVIDDSVLSGTACAVCGKAFPRAKSQVLIRTSGLRQTVTEALRTPFAASHKLRFAQRLNLAVLAHATHLAAGHVITEPRTESLGIALPA